VDLQNKGFVDGEEIVQLYVGYEQSSVERPIKDLKGFQKVKLKSGEKKTVKLILDPKNLAYYHVEKKEWVVESISYIIYVGSSSRNEDLLSKKIKII
jgi:beta-glucosidase